MQEIRKYEFGVPSNSMKPAPNLVKIRSVILEFFAADCIVCKTPDIRQDDLSTERRDG
jgi:hypothetical protein